MIESFLREEAIEATITFLVSEFYPNPDSETSSHHKIRVKVEKWFDKIYPSQKG